MNCVVQAFFKRLRPAFALPTRWQLSNTLLFAVYNEVAAHVQQVLAGAVYITLATDGWSRKQGDRHIINFMACYPGNAVFIDMHAAGAEKVTASYMFDSIQECLTNHGLKQKLAAVVTDTPNVMKVSDVMSCWR